MKKNTVRFANIISYLLHPLFMPCSGILYLYYSGKLSGFNRYSSTEQNIDNVLVITTVFFFTLLVPVIVAFLLKITGQIESLQMKSKEERYIPFTVTSTGILLSIILLYGYTNIYIHPVIKVFYIGCFLSVFLSLVITFQWKISIHMVGIGGFTGAIFLLNSINDTVSPNLFELGVCLILAGIVAFSRLSLKVHSMSQVIVGFLLGFFCESFFLWM